MLLYHQYENGRGGDGIMISSKWKKFVSNQGASPYNRKVWITISRMVIALGYA